MLVFSFAFVQVAVLQYVVDRQAEIGVKRSAEVFDFLAGEIFVEVDFTYLRRFLEKTVLVMPRFHCRRVDSPFCRELRIDFGF